MSTTISNVAVGEGRTTYDAPAHVKGVREGNQPGALEKTPGFVLERDRVRGTARRSTGIDPDARNPIDPAMPNLSPA